MLEIRNLTCGYANEAVVSSVNLTLEAGEIVAILGPNGVGKTTLFKTVLGILPRLGGEIELDGRPLDMRPGGPHMRRIAYVPQAHAPAFAFTVEEIVLMGRTSRMGAFSTPSDHDREAARRVLADLGLADIAERPYTQVSGGQRQMVLIARALVQEPDVLVMDEPAASLDLGNQARLLSSIRGLASGRGLAVLMTTHNPDHALLVADKVLLFGRDGGTLFGDAAQVCRAENLSRAYGTPVGIVEGPSACASGGTLRGCVLDLGAYEASQRETQPEEPAEDRQEACQEAQQEVSAQ